MIQLTKSGVRGHIDIDVAALEQRFAAEHVLRLPQLLDAEALTLVQCRVEMGRWIEMPVEEIGVDAVLQDDRLWHLLHFLANSPPFLNLVGRITGHAQLADFCGRVVRAKPETDNRARKHAPASSETDIGMCVHLASGDAVVFRASRQWPHELLSNEGSRGTVLLEGRFRTGVEDHFAIVRRGDPSAGIPDR